MDTRYVQSFVSVVESGSLAEAARRLDLTPAAIAARVRTLEEELGATLVKRVGRSGKATEAGPEGAWSAPAPCCAKCAICAPAPATTRRWANCAWGYRPRR